MKVACIVGARPNFMKIAPVIEAMKGRRSLVSRLVHTGQHYDDAMSRVFFEDLGLPRPDVYLGVGSGTHGRQTAKIMASFEELAEEEGFDYVLVVGDVNSTLACSLVAAKMGIRLGHVEAGLRSFDRGMPEEINRVVTDVLADDLFTSCEDAAPNLIREGIPGERIHFVGNVMIDSLLRHRERAAASPILGALGLDPEGYVLVTLHRPSNVDGEDSLRGLLETLAALGREKPVVFPVHPRTRARIESYGIEPGPGVRLTEPLGYLDFLHLLERAALVITDSGGIQEETTVLGVPCLTARENTERPITITEGTNRLVGTDPERILEEGLAALGRPRPTHPRVPRLWDGKSGERIAAVLEGVAGEESS